jgi:hypothetical protein
MTTREFGPYFVILNEDGSIHCPKNSDDPYLFSRIGPHDNHTPKNRRVVEAMIVVRDPLDREAEHRG